MSYREVVGKFLKHCGMKGLAPDTIKFYDKELKQFGRELVDVEAPIDDVRKLTGSHIEAFIEYQQSSCRVG
ncbi:hypothetical protein [Rossellomorea marisflavi]|uniref:hypothetical protein n=1 Tax=Rossellomorea marisflavi TaxID=189381 RepID=UPI0009A72CB0|nr:hypothetical protein [Rossellomorea marisflavi]